MKEEILNRYIEEAKKCAEKTGFDWLILLTHAFHESGGFEKIIGNNNFWGLKTPSRSKWPGKSVKVYTTEYEPVNIGESYEQALIRISKKSGCYSITIEPVKINNKDFWKVSLPQTFRDWLTTEDAVAFYNVFIRNNYPSAYNSRSDYMNYFKNLVNGKLKYATDPSYAAKCEDLYQRLKKRFG